MRACVIITPFAWWWLRAAHAFRRASARGAERAGSGRLRSVVSARSQNGVVGRTLAKAWRSFS